VFPTRLDTGVFGCCGDNSRKRARRTLITRLLLVGFELISQPATMISAEGTRRAHFRTVNDSLASDTSSRKQTQIVSALPASISVSAPETRR